MERAHNPEVAGSNPAPATEKAPETGLFAFSVRRSTGGTFARFLPLTHATHAAVCALPRATRCVVLVQQSAPLRGGTSRSAVVPAYCCREGQQTYRSRLGGNRSETISSRASSQESATPLCSGVPSSANEAHVKLPSGSKANPRRKPKSRAVARSCATSSVDTPSGTLSVSGTVAAGAAGGLVDSAPARRCSSRNQRPQRAGRTAHRTWRRIASGRAVRAR
jgi:hypothetical protein